MTFEKFIPSQNLGLAHKVPEAKMLEEDMPIEISVEAEEAGLRVGSGPYERGTGGDGSRDHTGAAKDGQVCRHAPVASSLCFQGDELCPAGQVGSD